METFSLTPTQIHQEMGKWSAYERECPSFWAEPEILDKTVPVLVAGVADVLLRFWANAEQQSS